MKAKQIVILAIIIIVQKTLRGLTLLAVFSSLKTNHDVPCYFKKLEPIYLLILDIYTFFYILYLLNAITFDVFMSKNDNAIDPFIT